MTRMIKSNYTEFSLEESSFSPWDQVCFSWRRGKFLCDSQKRSWISLGSGFQGAHSQTSGTQVGNVQGLGARRHFASEHRLSLSLCPIFHILFFKIFLLQCICFTILCWFLPYINMNQPYICPLPPETPSQLPPHPTALGGQRTRAWAPYVTLQIPPDYIL